MIRTYIGWLLVLTIGLLTVLACTFYQTINDPTESVRYKPSVKTPKVVSTNTRSFQSLYTKDLIEVGRFKDSTNAKPVSANSNYYANSSYCLKSVLIWWDPVHARENHGYGGKDGLINCFDLGCSVNVTYSEDVSMLADADIVIFHASFHTKNEDYTLFETKRSRHQIWIWQTWESPTRVLSFARKPPPWFRYNLTMSYSSKADIHVPYGRFIKFEHPKTLQNTNWLSGKTKVIAWIAHNCNSTTWARFDFVKRLQSRLPIDIYGDCGNLTCSGWHEACKALKDYKFFLAFENSECKDYITEKFWQWPFLYDLNVVPIVFGASKEDYDKVAPPNSFIHVSDFKSLDQFVKYIYLVENDVHLYNKYFEWKQIGRVVEGNDNFSPSRVCSLFHVPLPKQPHNINKEWWNNTCKQTRRTWHPFKQ